MVPPDALRVEPIVTPRLPGMARFDDVARERTDLSEADLDHLRALVADWTLLSDLAFADLVLWLPTWHGGGFVAADQVRPTTGPTGMFEDVVGQYTARGRRPLLDRAVSGRTVVAERGVTGPAPIETIPVIRAGRLLGVIERHSAFSGRDFGPLEQAYLEAADELAAMVVDGTFPPAQPLARSSGCRSPCCCAIPERPSRAASSKSSRSPNWCRPRSVSTQPATMWSR